MSNENYRRTMTAFIMNARHLERVPVGTFLEARAHSLMGQTLRIGSRGVDILAGNVPATLPNLEMGEGIDAFGPYFIGVPESGSIDPVSDDYMWLVKPYTLEELDGAGLIPGVYVEFQRQIKLLFDQNVIPSGVLAPTEVMKVNAVFRAGLVVRLRRSAGRSEAFNAVADRLSDAYGEFFSKQMKRGIQAVKDAQKDLEFWNTLRSVAESVASAPSTIAGQVAKIGGSGFGAFFTANPILGAGLLLVGLVAIAPNLLAAAKLLKKGGK